VRKVRSRWFALSGALGGLLGFLILEGVSWSLPGAGTRAGDVFRMAVYFSGFGLAVGAALGMTEGWILRKPGRLVYGLILGLTLGAAGGFAGGAVGQTIFGLLPERYAVPSNADLAIVLDSSGSMRQFFFWGNDPGGERRKAAKNLLDKLGETDRVAIVDFDDMGMVLFPLTALSSDSIRRQARSAVEAVDDSGGTDLSAGLDAGIQELVLHRIEGRKPFVIFLTDGEGYYSPSSAQRAKENGIAIYTIGLGTEVSAPLLQSIAAETGGRYFPVEDAAELTALFERILTHQTDMASRASGQPVAGAQPLDHSGLRLFLRILSWAVMGLAIGAGQGVRENTREDLRACALGGLLGGALGGAAFEPVTSLLAFGGGIAGRALGDVIVGACIGGSMRLAQEKLVIQRGKETTTLIQILPRKEALTLPSPAPVEPAPARATLASFETGADRERAMARAYRAGYSLREIGEHFRVPASAVRRAVNDEPGS
jgi:hypothetical protein